LSTRDVIGQAKGILMERQRLSAGDAFDLLRRASQRLNRKLADIAEHLARRYDVGVTEMPLPDGEHLADVARETAASGDVVYLTDHGQRLAAIVPAPLADLLERGSDMAQGRRVLKARAAARSGRHDVSERIEEILRSEVAL